MALALLVASYTFMFSVVHPYVDTRVCRFGFPDPLFRVIPFHQAWTWISYNLFIAITLAAAVALFIGALRGNHRPFLRWVAGLGVQAVLRSTTLVLVPLCRESAMPGTTFMAAAPTIDLGLARIPWRPFAANDFFYSGHVSEFLILTWATRSWPGSIRSGLIAFQIAQAYALIATRGHYSIDILAAVPFAYLADRLGLHLLDRLEATSRKRQKPTV